MINEYNFKENEKPVVNLQRKLLYLESSELEWPSGSFVELRSYIDDLEKEYSHCESWELDYRWTGYEDCFYFVMYTRYENDEEMQDRIENEREDLKDWEKIYNKRNQEKNEKLRKEKEERRKQFEKLRKEFE